MWWNPFRRQRPLGRPKGKAHFYNKNHIVKSKANGKKWIGYHKRKKRVNLRPNRGYQNLRTNLRVSPSLAAIINTNVATRAQIVKGVWAYIKEHKLQSNPDKRMIVPDKVLATVMGQEGQPMLGFSMMKYLKNHAKKDEPEVGTSQSQAPATN